MARAWVTEPTKDSAVCAAFLLANDLAVILLRNQIATAIGEDPLAPAGLDRWGRDVTADVALKSWATDVRRLERDLGKGAVGHHVHPGVGPDRVSAASRARRRQAANRHCLIRNRAKADLRS